MLHIHSQIFGAVHENLPKFNTKLLVDLREDEIKRIKHQLVDVYEEVIELLNEKNDSPIEYKSHRLLMPEERIMNMLYVTKNRAKTVDICRTEHDQECFEFTYEGQKFHTVMHIPYLRNNALTINSARYFLQFVISDNVIFYHPGGIGIKVIRGPIKFWRNMRHIYKSVTGKVYTDDVITTLVYLKSFRGTKKDLKSTILLYLLCKFGFYGVLDIFGIDRSYIKFVTEFDKDDTDHEYFRIRGICTDKQAQMIPTAQELLEDTSGFFLKVHNSIFEENDIHKRRVVAGLLYNLQYFEKYNSVYFNDNDEVIHNLYNTDIIYKIILGKTIRGMDADNEAQAYNNAEHHWESVDGNYIDRITKKRLAHLGIHCNNTYELFVHIWYNIDQAIVNHVPMSLYGRKFAVSDILLSGIVDILFRKTYAQMKYKKPLSAKNIPSILKAGSVELNKIFKHGSLVRASPSFYNDNYLLTAGMKKNRAIGSGNGSNSSTSEFKGMPKRRSTKQRNKAEQDEIWVDISMYAVESTNSVPSANPGIAGTINPFCEFEPEYNIITKPDHAEVLDAYKACLVSK